MTRLRSLLPVTLALLSLAAAGCGDTVVGTDKPALLTAHEWQVNRYTVNGVVSNQGPSDYTFASAGTYTSTLASGATETGTWSFDVDETTLRITPSGSTQQEWSILTLEQSSLKLKRTQTVGSTTVITEVDAVP